MFISKLKFFFIPKCNLVANISILPSAKFTFFFSMKAFLFSDNFKRDFRDEKFSKLQLLAPWSFSETLWVRNQLEIVKPLAVRF